MFGRTRLGRKVHGSSKNVSLSIAVSFHLLSPMFMCLLCEGTHAAACVCRSADNFMESVLSLQLSVDSEDRTWVTTAGAERIFTL